MSAPLAALVTPQRRRGVELLDEPGVDPAVRLRSLHDVARSNVLFGGRRAVLLAVERALQDIRLERRPATLLDVGTGLGDIPDAARRLAHRRGMSLAAIGLDVAEELAHAAGRRVGLALCGDAFRLPFADRSLDIVTCSQVLHHFPEPDARRLLAELDRVARVRVIVGDLRRSWLAAAGFWAASWPLRFHAVTRHDGVLSVLRGFTGAELRRLVREATGAAPRVTRRAGWRLTAEWTPRERAA